MMTGFTVYDTTTGRILRWGQCPMTSLADQLAGDGEVVIEGEFNGTRFHIVDGEPRERAPAPAAAPGYAELRRRAYPSVADQLDALWKGGDAVVEMQARVMEVKTRFPKS